MGVIVHRFFAFLWLELMLTHLAEAIHSRSLYQPLLLFPHKSGYRSPSAYCIDDSGYMPVHHATFRKSAYQSTK